MQSPGWINLTEAELEAQHMVVGRQVAIEWRQCVTQEIGNLFDRLSTCLIHH